MGTEVLRPQDFLNKGLGVPAEFSRRRCALQAGNPPRPARKLADVATHQKKQASRRPAEDAGKQLGRKGAANNPAMGMDQLTISKRGLSHDSGKDRRPSPRPEYAGPAFSVSLSPSSLSLPTFSIKKCFEDSATKDLRRLLRLD